MHVSKNIYIYTLHTSGGSSVQVVAMDLSARRQREEKYIVVLAVRQCVNVWKLGDNDTGPPSHLRDTLQFGKPVCLCHFKAMYSEKFFCKSPN